jgi:sugar/nucleoside kinase (ribokinase family)
MDEAQALIRRLEEAPAEEPLIAVVGDLGYDHIYTSPPLQGGREVIVGDYARTIAGAAGYVACGLARLGARVRLVTDLGDDPEGRELRAEAVERGILTEEIRLQEGRRSPFSLIFAPPGEGEGVERQVATYLGTLETFGLAGRSPEALLADARVVYSCNYFLLPRLREEIPALFAQARRRGVLTAYDANAGDQWGNPRALALLRQAILPVTDLVFLNEAEACHLTGEADPGRAAAVASPASRVVVVKLGARGALVRSDGTVRAVPAVPLARPVQDTVGAGDSFQAAFLYFLVLGFPVEQCAALGSINGASSVQQRGGTAGQLDRRGLIAELRRAFP